MPRPKMIPGAASRRTRSWFEDRTLRADSVPEIPSPRHLSVAVVVPAWNEARTVGAICRLLTGSSLSHLVDDVVVMDCDSKDRTAQVAAENGARVVHVGDVMPELPWVIGKGEVLWRSLAVIESDIVCFVDGDIRNLDAHFIERLVSPLLTDPSLSFTKGFYRRPLRSGSDLVPAAGGRVTELTARPLLNILYPELAGFLQPLAGEYAARVEMLRQLPFLTGYGVDVALLIDTLRAVGLDAMAQVDLEERVHRNRPLRELRSMATVISDAILRRAERDGRVSMSHLWDGIASLPNADGSISDVQLPQLERPPLGEVWPYVHEALRG